MLQWSTIGSWEAPTRRRVASRPPRGLSWRGGSLGLRSLACLVLATMQLTCAAASPPNVLVIVIDTWRADRVGWYGGDRQLTPFLDSLADRGTVFWNAYAQCSWTSPSVASLLTSRYTSQHGVTTPNAVLPAGEVTVGQALKQRGYTTGAFLANRILDPQFGFGHGFDVYDVFPNDGPAANAPSPANPMTRAMVKERAEVLNREGLAWLDAIAAGHQPPPPWFLYLQYMEPHIPYTPPPAILERMMSRQGNSARKHEVYARMLFTEHQLWNKPDSEALQVIEDLYDAEVASLDTRLRELFTELESRGFMHNAIVIITADHGEELLDHAHVGHGTTLYNELTHVPLLILAPGQTRRVDVREVVSLIDVAPTIVDLAGIPAPATFEGTSLTAAIRPGSVLSTVRAAVQRLGLGRRAPSAAYSQLLERAGPFQQKRHDDAIVVGSWKLLTSEAGSEGYDLEADPGEHNPRGLAEPEQRMLMDRLTEMRTRAHRNPHRERLDTLDEKTKANLRALGYGD